MISDMYQELQKAVEAGDVDRLEHLVQVEKADWRQNDDALSYLAMEKGHRHVVNWMMRRATIPFITAQCRRKAFQMGDFIAEDDIESMVQMMLPGHLRNAALEVDLVMASNNPAGLLALAMEYNVQGIFKYLSNNDPETVKDVGAFVVASKGLYKYAGAIHDLGGDIAFADGAPFLTAIRDGDIAVVKDLIRRGVDVNVMVQDMHALSAAVLAGYNGRGVAKEMTDILLDAGADIRCGKAAAIATLVSMRCKDVFEFVERVDAGSQLAMIAGLEESVPRSGRVNDFLLDHFPALKDLHKQRMVVPLFKPDGDQSDYWKNMLLTDVDMHDSLLLKLAVVGVDDTGTVVDYLLSRGANPNPLHDQPLRLAVMFEKETRIKPLVEAGADLFAHDSAAFRLALRGKCEAVQQELAAAIPLQTALCRREFEALYGTKPCRYDLRAAEGDDHGILLAAKAGLFTKLLQDGVIERLSADDFLTAGAKSGSVLLSILTARGEHDAIFSPVLWRDNAHDPQRLYDLLPAHDREKSADAYRELKRCQSSAHTEEQLRKGANRFRHKFN